MPWNFVPVQSDSKEETVLTILSNQEPVPVEITLGKDDVLKIYRPKGGYTHWARVETILIDGERMYVWFSRSRDRKSEFLAFAGMDPAFAAEIAPDVWAWISDLNNFSKHEVKLTVLIPPDLEHSVERS
jgi:hypothetical protein